MITDPVSPATSIEATDSDPRKAWRTPTIEDADIGALTSGTGTSGVEGAAFLKLGS